ncbi:tRNA (adenosine(37)-N6)-dimethylallyltransferase MiaA [Inhella gelatinilytica]|uniref:tRNA dimethylallyltransferase n=1 Tax=Inhella gelatinilytica TaxID=2795030 RepID=A0A931IXS1_9BURK|nr:tRNA (adenosine(37)-N6)-dimethylallyltransferase MiaA [Inhella gelatinilytica]MBH9553019.1 tRNA (adenosine(37)-N6)-dimethylallyltransferase MiaA [Inhella gelatinilytica]
MALLGAVGEVLSGLGPRLKPVFLVGPTGCGKTAAALAVAQRLPVEVISVDSALIYRGLDIGSAKPTAAEQQAVPHHLIDILDPLQSYSAAQFVADAQRLVSEVQARGRLPLLVGGTMLYVKALRDGISDMPPSSPAVRAQVDREAAALGWPALHAELQRVDPPTAARLHPTDSQRIQRAVEVYRLSGRPLSAWHAEAAKSPGVDWPLISLETEDRAWLHARLNARFDAMLDAGFLGEVRQLRARGDLHLDLPAMRCVGYRQAWEALDEADPPDLPRMRERAQAATRQLAKRQITWLRSMPDRTAVEAQAPDAPQRVLSLIQTLV